MKIHAFGKLTGLLLGLALIMPGQVIAQDQPDQPSALSELTISPDTVYLGFDTELSATADYYVIFFDSWARTAVWAYDGVTLTFMGCYDKVPDVPFIGGAQNDVPFTIPMDPPLDSPGTYEIFTISEPFDDPNCITSIAAGGLACLAGADVCPSDTVTVDTRAVVTIVKEYSEDHPSADPEVEITLTCPTGIVDGDTTTATKTTNGLTAEFVVTGFPVEGEDCTATETVPAGYVQSSAEGCDALTVTSGADDVGCTIENRPTEAVFAVDKNYSDANPVLAAVVTPSCTDEGGGPGITYSPESGNALHGTNFTTTVKYFVGDTTCTATEEDQAGYSFVPDSSDCDEGVAITDETDGTCVMFNQQDPVTILASKEFTSGGATATFDASCDAGTVTDIKTTASAGSPAEFEVSDFPYDGTTCDVTEPTPPAGYYQVSSTCDDLPILPSDDDTLCTITNASTRATFEVTKEFTDGDNPTEVEVTINCFTGLPIQQSQVIDEYQGVKFVVTDFDSGELDCEITEESLDGYTATYEPDGPGDFNSEGGCNFDNVEGGAENTCHIINDADPVDVVIEKLWVIEGAAGDQIDTSYKLTLYCDAEIAYADYCRGGQAQAVDSPEGYVGGWTCKKRFYGDDSDTFTAHVTPEYPSSSCWVEEKVYDDAVEIDNGCGDLTISAGNGASCLITNTVFFEGIPTLNQYGMALLALLMLGVGVVGFRRFA